MNSDPSHRIPAYLRIAASLREDIHQRRLVPGDELPSIADLAQTHGVAAATAHKAVVVLEQAGQVVTAHGVRTRVAPEPIIVRDASSRYKDDGLMPHEREAKRQGLQWEVRFVDMEEMTPSAEVAECMNVELEAIVVVRRYVAVVERAIVHLSEEHYPLDIASGTELAEPQDFPGPTHGLMRNHGHRLSHFEERLRYRAATQREYDALRCKHVAVITRTLANMAGRVIQVTTQSFNPDRYVFLTRVAAQ